MGCWAGLADGMGQKPRRMPAGHGSAGDRKGYSASLHCCSSHPHPTVRPPDHTPKAAGPSARTTYSLGMTSFLFSLCISRIFSPSLWPPSRPRTPRHTPIHIHNCITRLWGLFLGEHKCRGKAGAREGTGYGRLGIRHQVFRFGVGFFGFDLGRPLVVHLQGADLPLFSPPTTTLVSLPPLQRRDGQII
jgi:hypothetical protein